MADYKSTPLKFCASSTGGADVDVSATLFVDDMTDQDGDITLVDIHRARQCASLSARKKNGAVVLRIVVVAVPLAGNGEFEVTFELTHPAIEGDPFTFTKRGDVATAEPKTYVLAYELP